MNWLLSVSVGRGGGEDGVTGADGELSTTSGMALVGVVSEGTCLLATLEVGLTTGGGDGGALAALAIRAAILAERRNGGFYTT